MQKKKAKDNSSSLGAVEKNQGSQHEKLEAVQALDEIGEYSKLMDFIKNINKRQERTEKKVDVIAKSLNKLVDKQEQQYDIPEETGGPMYG